MHISEKEFDIFITQEYIIFLIEKLIEIICIILVGFSKCQDYIGSYYTMLLFFNLFIGYD